MIIVTTNDIPGYRVVRTLGECFGLTVRSRHIGSNIGAGFKALVGGELQGITKMLHESRNEALSRLAAEAQNRGGNAVLAFRFETNEYAGTGTESCAYGTAVYVVPNDEPQAAAAEFQAPAQGDQQFGEHFPPQGDRQFGTPGSHQGGQF